MNQLTKEKRCRVVAALVEGCSIRSTVRMTGVAKNTVVKLLSDLGQACAEYMDQHLRGLHCKRIQCDEIWAFVYAKDKNLPLDKQGKYGYGSVWTWVGMDADTKLVASWLLGNRDAHCAKVFMDDLAGRLANRVQLTTDGHKVYLEAVRGAFGNDVDYAMLVKLYGASDVEPGRYSPAHCTGAIETPIVGNPNPFHVSTSYVERQNLTMRMCMRRLTRLTNGFSKKFVNLEYALALQFMHYNFCRIHQTLRVTPAMAAGVSDKLWEIEDMVALLG